MQQPNTAECINNIPGNTPDTQPYYCYILTNNINNRTYNGSTNNLHRRIRQHNGMIVGGAHATKEYRPWQYCAFLTGFKTQKEALSCEWRIRHPTNSKKRPVKYCGCKGRIKSLNYLMTLGTWTSKSTGLSNGNTYTLYVDKQYSNLLDTQLFRPNIVIKMLNEHDMFDKLLACWATQNTQHTTCL